MCLKLFSLIFITSVFFLGCGNETNNSNDSDDSSSSEVFSSSSSVDVHSGCIDFVNGTTREHYGKEKPQFCDERDGKKYVYVQIGEQTWMAENLNYETLSGSWCYGEDGDIWDEYGIITLSSAEIQANCKKYGRLYDRDAAQNGCPEGWRLPTIEEWRQLLRFIDGANDTSDLSLTAGKYLKATNGWDYYDEYNAQNLDTYGFSALPGGLWDYNYNVFYDIGRNASWWTFTDYSEANAYCFGMIDGYDGTNACTLPKDYGYSVRCIYESSSQIIMSSSSFEEFSSSSDSITGSSSSLELFGTFTDVRDGKVYKYVTIGTQTWMAENLNYQTTNDSWCYENDESNCVQYGRLYDWPAAMALPSTCNSSSVCTSQINIPHQGVCPEGWHLPDTTAWRTLVDFAGGSTAGTTLKSATNWDGSDNYGFNALPAGIRRSNDGKFLNIGNYSYWWTATRRGSLSDFYHTRYMYSRGTGVSESYGGLGVSVRCVKNSFIDSLSASSSSVMVEVSSSSIIAQSSSSVQSSSSSKICNNFIIDDRDGQKYCTVQIGNQIWMAENLNYETTEGSQCYDNKEANCGTYGRRYNWGSATLLSATCNSSECSTYINYPHQGVCPVNWHIPTHAEWQNLIDHAGYDSAIKLKGNRWYGTDLLGFNALPGGAGGVGGGSAGSDAYWWTTDESGRDGARLWLMYSHLSYLLTISVSKNIGASIRCVSNNTLLSSSSSEMELNSSSSTNKNCVGFIEGSTREHYGKEKPQFCDERDGKKYVYVKIGEQTWMAQNLNYVTATGSWCYENGTSFCDSIAGRFYDWSTTMALGVSCHVSNCSSQIQTNHKGICPQGWHVPTNAEWDQLARYVDGTSETSSPYASKIAGEKLKGSEWSSGTDDFGFSAFPESGSYCFLSYEGRYNDGSFCVGSRAYWWSASELGGETAYLRSIRSSDEKLDWNDEFKTWGLSVRCVKDQ